MNIQLVSRFGEGGIENKEWRGGSCFTLGKRKVKKGGQEERKTKVPSIEKRL